MCDFPLSSLKLLMMCGRTKGRQPLKHGGYVLQSTNAGFTVQKHKPEKAVDGQSASLVRTRQIVMTITDGCIWLEVNKSSLSRQKT